VIIVEGGKEERKKGIRGSRYTILFPPFLLSSLF